MPKVAHGRGGGAINGGGREGGGGQWWKGWRDFSLFQEQEKGGEVPIDKLSQHVPGQRLSRIENVHKICVAVSSKKSHFSAISYSKGYARAKLEPRMPSLDRVTKFFDL